MLGFPERWRWKPACCRLKREGGSCKESEKEAGERWPSEGNVFSCSFVSRHSLFINSFTFTPSLLVPLNHIYGWDSLWCFYPPILH